MLNDLIIHDKIIAQIYVKDREKLLKLFDCTWSVKFMITEWPLGLSDNCPYIYDSNPFLQKLITRKIREKLSTYFCLTLHDRKSANFRQFFGQIIFAEKEYFQRFTLRKIPWFCLIFWYGNCAFPQNFHTRKVGEITVVYAVLQAVACKSLKSFCFHKQYSQEH